MSFGKLEERYIFKCIIFGNANVGKTTLTKRFAYNVYGTDYKKTIGVDFEVKKLMINNVEHTLQLWDFSGEKQFETLFPMYLRGSDGGIFMFDISNEKSFHDFKHWLNIIYHELPSNYAKLSKLVSKTEIIQFGFIQQHFSIPIIVVAGKMDLLKSEESRRELIHKTFYLKLKKEQKKALNYEEFIQEQEKELLQKIHTLRYLANETASRKKFRYFECSSKDNLNITEIFEQLAKDISNNRKLLCGKI